MAKSKYKRQREMSIPDRFVPRFFNEIDRRSTIYKEVKYRVTRMMEDVGADSYQKQALVEEACFIMVLLETQKVKAAETGEFDAGSYTQQVNCLSGILTKLGLNKKAADEGTLEAYLAEVG